MIRFLIVLCCVAKLANAADLDPRDRFRPWFKVLTPALSKTDSESAAEDVLSGLERVAAFNLQELGRLYQHSDKKFKKFKNTFKDLEDAIGDAKQARDLLKAAKKRRNKKEIKRRQAKYGEALDQLEDFLKGGWLGTKDTHLTRARSFIENYPFRSAKEERAVLIDALKSQLVDVQSRKWKLDQLEKGNGVHELRRELRRFLLQAQVLDGLIQHELTDRCPVKEFKPLLSDAIANSKYSELKRKGVDPCYVTPCVYIAVVEAVGTLGDIKDLAEDQKLEHIEGKMYDEAVAAWDKLDNNNALGILEKDLQACL